MEKNQDTSQDTGLHFLDYWRVIRSRKEIVLAVTLLVVLTGTAFTFMLPKKYDSESRILVNKDFTDVEVFERQLTPGYDPFFLRTQYEIIQSRPILYQVIRDLNLQEEWGKQLNEDNSPVSKKAAHGMLAASLSVNQSRDTSLIAIRVRREDPDEAARIANQIAEVYREQRMQVKNREMKRGIDALDNELKKQQAKVDAAEEHVELLRKKLNVVMYNRGIRADEIKLQKLEADRISARVEMLIRKARFEALDGLQGDELLHASAYLVGDPALKNIHSALIDREVGLRLLLETLGENHPDVKQLRAAADELRSQLSIALQGMKKGLRADYDV
ncbi:MAG: Wzz/FepE/Etk N-terminal domain-containing protein, partial [Verrucomicrobiota bacterium]